MFVKIFFKNLSKSIDCYTFTVMENDNLILAPKDTVIKVDSKVLITTGVGQPLVATVKHINSNNRCSLVAENGQSMDRYTMELKPLTEDKTPIVGEIIQQSGDGSKQYDWVKTIVTHYEPKKIEMEQVISFDEYNVKKKMQEYKAKLSIQQRTEFNEVMREWGEFNTREAESRAAEEAAGEDL